MLLNKKILFICLLTGFEACRKGGPCEEPLFVTNSGLTIDFIEESSGKYMYEEFFPLYDIDSLKITDEEGDSYDIDESYKLVPGSIVSFTQASFGPLFIRGKDENSFDEKIEKQYYIQYKVGDMDTIIVKYKSEKTKCGSHFDPLEVYQRGFLLSTEYEDTGANVIVTKD